MAKTSTTSRTYPWTDRVKGHDVVFRYMAPEDHDKILEFTKKLPKKDLIYLRMDVTKSTVVDEWMENIKRGRTVTVAAETDDHIIGYASLHRNEMLWTRHLGELRMLVGSEYRGSGLGKRLTNEIFQIAKEAQVDRIFVNIPADLPHLRTMMEKMGFMPEALLTDWLVSSDNRTHDLLVMTHRVEGYDS